VSSRYDVAIVGSGPAGATAAIKLAGSGAKVILLEKYALPRVKPCGGGVAPQVQEWFDFDLMPAVSLVARSVRCTYGVGSPVEGDVAGPGIWMVRRETFDHFLVQQAAARGAEVRDACPVDGLIFDNGCWRLTTSQEPVEATYVIAADGAKGPCAKWLGIGIKKQNLAGAIEAESELVRAQDGVVHLDFGTVPGGYLWNFPKGDGHSLGGGALKGSSVRNLRDITRAYCDSFHVDMANCRVYGHPMSLWFCKQRLHGKNCLVAGEAACVVDPFTAEGIRPSILSGKLAAEALLLSLKGVPNALDIYTESMHEHHGVDMMWAKRLATLFYMAPKLAYEHGVMRAGAVNWVADLMSGKRQYRDAAASALRRLNPLVSGR
jgi:geranylgeranyl reductase family protein